MSIRRRHQHASNRMWRGVVAVVMVMAALLTVTACGAGPTSQSPHHRILRIGATAEPPNLDPTSVAAAAGSQVLLYNTYETLIKTDADGKLQPLLAERWEVSSDRLTYRFFLNQAAKFASGTPVTAQAVKDNLDRVRDKTAADKAGTIVAAKLVNQMSVVADTTVVNDTTIDVKLKQPSNVWLYELSSTGGIIADPASFATLGTKTAGSGPYQVGQWNKGDSIVLTPNANYWGTPGRFDQVVFKYYADPNAMNSAMLSGQLDIISNLQAPDTIGQFTGKDEYRVIEGTTNGEVVLSLNHARPVMQDKRVRQAIAMAIDKKGLLKTVWNNKGTVIGSMAVPTDPYYEDLSSINAYNPTRAKQLLVEAGYSSGLTLKLKPAALPYASRSAQFVASSLRDIGVTVIIEELQFPDRWSDVVYGKADYDMSIVSHVEARDLVTYTNPNYYWRYNNPEFTKLYQAADQASADNYPAAMKKAARYLADDAAGVWLFVLPNLVITRSHVSGVPQNAPSLSFDVSTVSLD